MAPIQILREMTTDDGITDDEQAAIRWALGVVDAATSAEQFFANIEQTPYSKRVAAKLADASRPGLAEITE